MPSTEAKHAESQAADVLDRLGLNEDEFGAFLESQRGRLQAIARTKMRSQLARRVSASDAVQETMLAAHRDLATFRGHTSGQLSAWLKSILTHKLLNLLGKHLSRKRDARREVSLTTGDQQEHNDLQTTLIGKEQTPSGVFASGESKGALERALLQLPKDYQLVIRQRNFEGKRFQQIAEQMNRSPQATRMLWVRAIQRLRQLYEMQELVGSRQ